MRLGEDDSLGLTPVLNKPNCNCFCIHSCGKKNGNVKITQCYGRRSFEGGSLFFCTSSYISIRLSVSNQVKEGCNACWLRHREKWNIYFWLKMIEEQQKIRSVLKEFISHRPHIWYIYIYLTWFVRIHGSIAEDEVFTQLIGYFVYQILALDIKTWTKRSFITSYWLKWYITFILANDPGKIQNTMYFRPDAVKRIFWTFSYIWVGEACAKQFCSSLKHCSKRGGKPMFNNWCEFLKAFWHKSDIKLTS